MNELIKKKVLNLTVNNKTIFDILEQKKTILEEEETFKYLYLKSGLPSCEIDDLKIEVHPSDKTSKIDRNKMKDEFVYVIDGNTGEREEVNALEYCERFRTEGVKKPFVAIKEKK